MALPFRCFYFTEQAHNARKEKAHEHSQTHRLRHHVHHTGHAYGGAAPADGVVLRDWPSGQRQSGERRGCRGVGIPASRLSRSRWLFSPQCAPDAGFLAVVQRHAGTAWRSASLELDTERCDHGGRAARRGAPLVHPAGYSTESIQGGASANDRGFCVSGKCSRRKGRCVV